MKMTWLAQSLRDAGLTVVEEPGWRDRGAELPANPPVVIFHHTAGAATGDLPSRRILIEGRSDLPGPLCHVGLARSGKVHVIAAGKANHAGRGAWQGITASSSTFGIEAENAGRGEPWPKVQLDAADAITAVVLRRGAKGAEYACGHREWALPAGRKIDPAGVDLDSYRLRVNRLLNPPPAPPPFEEDDMGSIVVNGTNLVLLRDGTWQRVEDEDDAKALVAVGHKRLPVSISNEHRDRYYREVKPA